MPLIPNLTLRGASRVVRVESLADLGMITSCTPPELVDTSDYNPRSGLNADDDGKVLDQSSDAAIPKVGKLMMDMMVAAMACDLTAVGTLQWSDTEAKHTFPWLGLREHLLLSILRLFGDERASFGDVEYSNGPLSGLA